MRFCQLTASTVANMKNNHPVSIDGKQYSVLMRFAAKQKLAHLERKLCTFGCDRTSLRKFGKRGYRFS
jgi:hypothetical protein